jgi:uncharacterized protein (UPF0335 family)
MTIPNDPYNIAADELRAFVERLEAQKARVKDENEALKDIFAEAKGRGYSGKALKKIIADRARKPDDVAEEEAVLDTYKAALGMV